MLICSCGDLRGTADFWRLGASKSEDVLVKTNASRDVFSGY